MNKKLRTYKILVADDEPHVASELKFSLENNTEHVQYKILNALTGEETLQKAVREKPDLIILDMMIPKNRLSAIDPRQGLEIYKRLQKDPATKEIDIIFSSAFKINNIQEETSNEDIQQFIKFHDDDEKYDYIKELSQNQFLSHKHI